MENKSDQGFPEKVFHLSENRTDVKTEIIAGIAMFMITAYILAVNPNILSVAGVNRGAVFTATALTPLVATPLMAAFANYPFVLTPDMGLNTYSTYTAVLQMGYTWQMALAAIFMEGLTFITLSFADMREAIFSAILMNLKHAVSAGIGLFIAFIGLQDAKIVVEDTTLVSVFSFKGSLDAGTLNPVGITILLALIGVLITDILVVRNIKGDIFWDILVTWVLGIICEVTGPCQPNAELGMFSVLPNSFNNFGIQSMAPIFLEMDFNDVLSLNFIVIVFAFLFVGVFDTLGTLIGVASGTDILGKDRKLPKIRGALLSDAIGTSLDTASGTSTAITFVESASGVTEDGRTGLVSVVVAISFGLSLFLSPILLAISSSATTPALIIVGFLMISSILKISFNDFTEAIPSYTVIIAIPFIYSISEGIAMSVIFYVAINVATGRAREKRTSLLMCILAILFVPKYVLI